MPSSPEPGRGAVLLDANVLSRLALIRCSDILSTAFPGRCYVAPAVYREIEAGIAVGVSYLECFDRLNTSRS
jgi:hypothetical protein